MTINYTTLLGLAQPVTGTEAGTWGTVVNDEITALVEQAIAGGTSINVTAGDVTLTTTTGASNQARNAVLVVTGTPGVSRNIIAPSSSKVYIVINGSNGAVVIKGAATTGVTIAAGSRSLVAWNGSDFVEVGQAGDVDGPASSTDTAIARFSGTSGKVLQNSGVTIDGSNVLSAAGIKNSALTSGRITYAGASGVLQDSAGLTFDGTNFATTGTVSGTKLIPTGGAVTGNGMYLPAANAVAITTNGAQAIYIDSSQNVGIGTSAPTTKLTISNNTVLPSAGAVSPTSLWIVGADSAQNNLVIDSFGAAPSIIGRRATGTAASPSATASGNTLIAIQGRGYGTTGYSSGQRAHIIFRAAENWTDTAQGAEILINNTPNGTTTLTERIRINNAGNVGIGTTSPDSGVSATQTVLEIANSNVAALSLNNTGAKKFTIYSAPGSLLSFYDVTAGATRMVIDSSGYVGINTTSPRAPLDVGGNIYLAGGNQVQITGSAGITGLQLIGQDSAESLIGTMSAQALVIRTNSTERMRITSTGNALLGTTVDFSTTTYPGNLAIGGVGIYPFTINTGATNTTGFSTLNVENLTTFAGTNGASNQFYYSAIFSPKISNTGAGGTNNTTTGSGFWSVPTIQSSGTSARLQLFGGQFFVSRSNSNDTSTNTNNQVIGVAATAQNASAGSSGIVTGTMFGGNFIVNNNNGTVTSQAGVSITTNTAAVTASQASTTTDAFQFRGTGLVGTSSGGPGSVTNYYGLRSELTVGATGTVTNYYGLYLATPSVTGTLTNRWGVYQESTAASNYFAGKTTFNTTASVGNATPASSGAGITFPATQSASSDANTLDDYEEGTWTPVVTAGSGSLTSYTSSGTYTKVGNLVTVMGYITLTNVGTASNVLNYSGLPFTSNYSTGYIQPATPVRESNSTGNMYFAIINGGAATGYIQNISAGGIDWTNNYRYSFVITYQTS